ncbi:molybdenum cofactor guanylyltransferase [Maricaulis maris]|uniref:molybdenum cofactor guanylyltransferase n=1 Tax=Maricaulis maris TaxID=74318 RepID=UPI003B8B637B
MRRTGLILAGGQARRMGGIDKASAVLNGRPLIQHVLERLTPQVDQVLISGRSDYGSGLTVLADRTDGPAGPAAGLHAAAKHLAEVPDCVLITVPVDAPFLAPDLVERLCAGPLPAIAHAGGRLQPAFSAWRPADVAAQLTHSPAGAGLALIQLARNANARTVAFDGPGAFLNINSAEDLAAAEADVG